MNKNLKRIITEKGQGLTEYVLILAFVAGLAFMMFGGSGSLKGTVANTLTETVRILAGLFEEKIDWGHTTIAFDDSNKAERLAYDQNALGNIAGFFINKTWGDISENYLKGNIDSWEREGGNVLGWFGQNNDKSMYFNKNDSVLKVNSNAIFDWMQGGNGDASKYDKTNQYLVSDYVRGQYPEQHTNGASAGNGPRMRFEFDKSSGTDPNKWTVTKVTIAIDRNNQTNSDPAKNSSGLEMTVTADGTRTPTSTQLKN